MEFYSNILESGFVTAALLSNMTKIQTENAKFSRFPNDKKHY